MCDKATDDFLLPLTFVTDWFVTSKMIKKLHTSLFTDDNINLDDVNFDEDDPETIIHIRLMAWHNKPKQCKAFEKHKQRINTCSKASNKIVELVLVRR